MYICGDVCLDCLLRCLLTADCLTLKNNVTKYIRLNKYVYDVDIIKYKQKNVCTLLFKSLVNCQPNLKKNPLTLKLIIF